MEEWREQKETLVLDPQQIAHQGNKSTAEQLAMQIRKLAPGL